MKKEITNVATTATFTAPKQYKIDIEKVLESEDANAKINAIFIILKELNITIDDYVMTDELKKFIKEM